MSLIETEFALASVSKPSHETATSTQNEDSYARQLQALRADPDVKAAQVLQSVDSGEITLPDAALEQLRKARCERILEAIRLQVLLEDPLRADPSMPQLDEVQAKVETYSDQIIKIGSGEIPVVTDSSQERRSLHLGAVALGHKVAKLYRRTADLIFVEGEYGEDALIPN